MTSTRDMVKWGLKQWTMYVHMHSKEELKRAHDAIHKEHLHRRVRTALERRLMTSTRDMVKWGLKQWTVYVHMHSKEELKRAHDAIHKEHLHRRVRTALERRLMTSTRDMVKWSFDIWRQMFFFDVRRELIDASSTLHGEYAKKFFEGFMRRRVKADEKLNKYCAFRSWRENTIFMWKEKVTHHYDSLIFQRDTIIARMDEKCKAETRKQLGAQNFRFQEDFRLQTARYKEEIARITNSFEDAVMCLEEALENALRREQEAERELKLKLDKAYQFGLECAQIRSEAKFNEILETERKKLEYSYDQRLAELLRQDELVRVVAQENMSHSLEINRTQLKFSHHKLKARKYLENNFTTRQRRHSQSMIYDTQINAKRSSQRNRVTLDHSTIGAQLMCSRIWQTPENALNSIDESFYSDIGPNLLTEVSNEKT